MCKCVYFVWDERGGGGAEEDTLQEEECERAAEERMGEQWSVSLPWVNVMWLFSKIVRKSQADSQRKRRRV